MRSSTSLSGPAPTLRYYVVLLVALFSFFKSTVAVSIALQTALMPGFPNVTQCAANFDLLWKGGAAPWIVTITGATPDDIIEKGTVDLPSFLWSPISLPVGSTGQITITDLNQEQAISPYTIVSNPKGINLCGVFTPLTSPTKSAASSAVDPTSTTSLISSTTSPTSSTSSASPTPTAPSPVGSDNDDNQPSHTILSDGAIAGIAVGASLFLFALVGIAIWLVRRRRQRPRFMDLGVEWTMYASRNESNVGAPDSALGPASEKRNSLDSLHRTRSAESV